MTAADAVSEAAACSRRESGQERFRNTSRERRRCSSGLQAVQTDIILIKADDGYDNQMTKNAVSN